MGIVRILRPGPGREADEHAFKTGRIFALGSFLAYALATFFVLRHHEPWRDEAYTWLVARDLTLPGIIIQMGHAGHPSLWPLLLSIPAKLGFPYAAEFLLHWAIALGGAWLLLSRAPFPKPTRLLMVFSYYLGYEYVIIARHYVLTVFLLFLIATLYPRRFEKPLAYAAAVFLLYQSNTHSIPAALALSGLFAWEAIRTRKTASRPVAAALVVMAAGLAIAGLQLGGPWVQRYHALVPGTYLTPVSPDGALTAWVNALFPGAGDLLRWRLAGIAAAAILAATLLRKPQALIFFLVWAAGLGYIFTFKYPGTQRHHGLYLVLLIFSLWLARSSPSLYPGRLGRALETAGSVILHAILLASAWACLRAYAREIRYPFSGSTEMARFLIDNRLDGEEIAAYRSSVVSSVLPYLPSKRFWYLDHEDYGTYFNWDEAYNRGRFLNDESLLARYRRSAPGKKNGLLLLSRPMRENRLKSFKLLHATSGEVFGHGRERFYLYRPTARKSGPR